MTEARGKRVRVSVDVDVLASVTFDHAAGQLAGTVVHACSHLAPTSYKVHGVSVSRADLGTIIGRWDAQGEEYVRVSKATGEVMP